jgi:diguanylate cyclase (GGDEF)-like protein
MSVSTHQRQRQFGQKQGLIFSLLGILILVEVLTVFAVLASQRFATERALSEYTNELLRNVVDETRENAEGYLASAADSINLAAGLLGSGLLDAADSARLDAFFLQQLLVIPQIDAVYFGDDSGRFVFSKRAAADDGYVSKIISPGLPDTRRVTLVERDAALAETARRADPDDRFDPRQRPWYQQASAAQGVVWTAPYIFYTSKRPGLTVAREVRRSDGSVLGVVGADVELSALSQFLQTQRVGRSGAAFIVYGDGGVLAHPRKAEPVEAADGSLQLPALAQVDPVGAFASQRFERQGARPDQPDEPLYDRFRLRDTSYLAMFTPLIEQGAEPWLMGIYAPEDELARKIREGQHESIILGVVVSLLVVTAAVMVGMVLLRPLYAQQRQAREDPQTGVLDRQSFDEQARRRLRSAGRIRQRVSALLIRIDGLSRLTERHGETVGRDILRLVAQRLTAGVSRLDQVGRYGDGEFALLVPGASYANAEGIARRLTRLVETEPFQAGEHALAIRVSIGIAETTDYDETPDSLLRRAHQAMTVYNGVDDTAA